MIGRWDRSTILSLPLDGLVAADQQDGCAAGVEHEERAQHRPTHGGPQLLHLRVKLRPDDLSDHRPLQLRSFLGEKLDADVDRQLLVWVSPRYQFVNSSVASTSNPTADTILSSTYAVKRIGLVVGG